jgi:hypothetical protein
MFAADLGDFLNAEEHTLAQYFRDAAVVVYALNTGKISKIDFGPKPGVHRSSLHRRAVIPAQHFADESGEQSS